MNSVFPLTRFEIRFTPILNFSRLIREIASPYLRLTSSFNINNQGRIDENIKLNFEEDRYSIDCMLDRLVISFEDNPERFAHPNSMIKIFWEILEKVTQSSSFGALRNYIFLCYEIKPLDLSFNEILKKIKNKFLNASVDSILPDTTDLAVVLEKNSQNKQRRITFGPYTESDNKKHNLFPFTGNKLSDFNKKYGTLLVVQASGEFTKINQELLKDLSDEQKKHSTNFSI